MILYIIEIFNYVLLKSELDFIRKYCILLKYKIIDFNNTIKTKRETEDF